MLARDDEDTMAAQLAPRGPAPRLLVSAASADTLPGSLETEIDLKCACHQVGGGDHSPRGVAPTPRPPILSGVERSGE